MPDLASRRPASTSCVLLPIDETIPIPVTTTRLIFASSANAFLECGSGAARLWRGVLEQAHLEVERAVDHGSVGREPAIGDAEHELRPHHPLDVDAIDDSLHRRQHLAREFKLAHADRAAFAPGP